MSSDKCVPARVLFPAEAPGAKREKGSQRKKIISVGQLLNKVSHLAHLLGDTEGTCLVLFYALNIPRCPLRA